MPQKVLDQNKPYLFTDGPSPEEAATLTAEFIAKQAGPGKAEFAGNDATKNKKRVYGIVHYDTPDGQYKGLFDTLKAQLKKNKITPEGRPVVLPRPFTGARERPHDRHEDEGRRRHVGDLHG